MKVEIIKEVVVKDYVDMFVSTAPQIFKIVEELKG